MKHRVFVALPISRELQNEILEWEKKFKSLAVRWLEGKNLHITLVPPFYADEEEVEKLKNILEKITGFGAFPIEFSRVTFGPEARRPRLIWAEGETSQELLNLRERTIEVLRSTDPKLQMHANLRREKRPLKLHLTLARFRPESFSSFGIQTLNEKVEWVEKVQKIALFESTLSRDGASYQIISSRPL